MGYQVSIIKSKNEEIVTIDEIYRHLKPLYEDQLMVTLEKNAEKNEIIISGERSVQRSRHELYDCSRIGYNAEQSQIIEYTEIVPLTDEQVMGLFDGGVDTWEDCL